MIFWIILALVAIAVVITMPTPATLAGIIATGTLDPAYEDSDILNDEPVSETTS